jgi:hypothetical protein
MPQNLSPSGHRGQRGRTHKPSLMAMLSLSAEDPEPMHILGQDAQSDDDLAGGLGLQPESVR